MDGRFGIAMNGAEFQRLVDSINAGISQIQLPPHEIRIFIQDDGQIWLTPAAYIDAQREGVEPKGIPQPVKARVGFSKY